MPELPMFPLGTVLFPHMALPLHVFEPRYRALMQDVLNGGQEFGVTLITRGHEVGGGDIRAEIGTVARVLRADEFEDGRWMVIGVGTRRIKIESWLPEEPYPRAEITELPEPAVGDDVVELLTELEPNMRRVLGMLSELGEEGVPATFELDSDPQVAAWQAVVMMPLNPFDAQRVLSIDSSIERLRLTASLISELEETLSFRLQDG